MDVSLPYGSVASPPPPAGGVATRLRRESLRRSLLGLPLRGATTPAAVPPHSRWSFGVPLGVVKDKAKTKGCIFFITEWRCSL